jgi:GxxExxY protein
MGHAYASQNEIGRLCEESVYETDLKARLLSDGFKSVETQVPISVTHGIFSKKYWLDLVVNNALYELKTDATLVGEHEAQLLNYILLLGLGRGKLLNLRPPKVQGKTIATSLTLQQRRQFTFSTSRWKLLSPACDILQTTMLSLLEDWGAFLDLTLYQEALVHFLGGENSVKKRVRLRRQELELGTQMALIHSSGLAFRITAFTEDLDHVETHLRRFLMLTDLQAVQWINLNHSKIEFTTIINESRENCRVTF